MGIPEYPRVAQQAANDSKSATDYGILTREVNVLKPGGPNSGTLAPRWALMACGHRHHLRLRTEPAPQHLDQVPVVNVTRMALPVAMGQACCLEHAGAPSQHSMWPA